MINFASKVQIVKFPNWTPDWVIGLKGEIVSIRYAKDDKKVILYGVEI
jgi:hypothetical protein